MPEVIKAANDVYRPTRKKNTITRQIEQRVI